MNNSTLSQEMKVCKQCSNEYLLTEENFRKMKDKRKGNGYYYFQSFCRSCEKAKNKEWKIQNKERTKQYMKQYRTANKEVIAERSKQYRKENEDKVKQWKKDWASKEENKEKKRQYYHENKDWMQVQHKEWLENNKEKVLERQREYYKEKPEVFAEIRQRRRSRQKNVEHNFSWEEWEGCLEHFNHQCAYCGKEKKLEQEHFIPLNNGGEYTANNIIPACKSCNSSKCDHDFFEWFPSKRYYSKQRESKILKYLSYKNNEQQLALFK